ncbi:MAG: hypothetical protein IJQ00_07780 [Kiritimatiellae bacterium]|nr:hypothetical protein [Kiritimatiellia bacterium]
MEITRRNFMLGAGAVLSTPAFAAGNDVGGKSKSGGVKRFEFGEAGACREVTCPAGWNTYRDAEHTVDSMTLYDAWRKSGCMKGAFFGHDHTNTFDGMDKNGIRIGMTKSINCGGSYGDGDPGLRVFRIRTFGSFESWTETEITLRSVL